MSSFLVHHETLSASPHDPFSPYRVRTFLMHIRIVVVILLLSTWCARTSGWKGDYLRLRLEQGAHTPEYTIHGLWPEWAVYCSEEGLDMDAIEGLLPQLDAAWPSIKDNNTAFWAHEWAKHGTCTGMDQYSYFDTTLRLHATFSNLCPHAGSNGLCNFCFFKDDLATTCEYVRVHGGGRG